MKQYLSILVLSIILSATTAFAENTAAPYKNQQRKEFREGVREDRKELFSDIRENIKEERKEHLGEIKDRRAEMKEELVLKREAFLAKVKEIRKERASVRKSFVEERFAEAIANISALQTRVSTKIDELKDKGYDMSEASHHLDESKAALAKASDLLETFKTTQVSDTNESSVTKPRELAKQIEALLKEARAHLREAIASIKMVLTPSSEDNSGDTE